MRVVVIFGVCAVLGGMLSGCAGPSAAGTPTVSGDDLIRTAEVAAGQTRQAYTSTPSPTPIAPSATPIRETATPSPTATPLGPVVTAAYNAYVRAGPDAVFEWIDFLLEGQTAEVVGRYEHAVDGTWWYIHRIGPGRDGWVWSGAVTLSGDASGVPSLEPPPLP